MEQIFDTALVRARKERALARLPPGADFLIRQAADDLVDRLGTVMRDFAEAGVLQDHGGYGEKALRDSGKVANVHPLRFDAQERLGGEAESLDLIVSLHALHELNDMPGMLTQIRRRLRPDGLLLACLAGAGTLTELREAMLVAESETTGGVAPRVIPFADVRDMGALLQRAGLALPVTDVDRITVRYDDMFALMRDLRAMGATSSLAARSRVPARRELFLRAAAVYAERFSDPDGRVRATFSTIWISGWAPHHGQQKPLAPGSATVPLARALSRK